MPENMKTLMTRIRELDGHCVYDALCTLQESVLITVPFLYSKYKRLLPNLELNIHGGDDEPSWFHRILIAFDGTCTVAVDVIKDDDGNPIIDAKNPRKMYQEELGALFFLVIKDLSQHRQLDLREEKWKLKYPVVDESEDQAGS